MINFRKKFKLWFFDTMTSPLDRSCLTRDLEELLTEKLFFSGMILLIIMATVLSVIYGLFGLHTAALGQILIAIGFFFALLGLRQLGHRLLISNVFIGVFFLMTWYRFDRFGGLEDPTFFTVLFIPIFTMSFLPAGWAVFWTLIFLVLDLTYKKVGMSDHEMVLLNAIDTKTVVRIMGITFTNFISLGIVYSLKTTYRNIQQVLIKEKEDKTNLLRIVAHDLANPLAILHMQLEEIYKKNPTAQLERALRAKDVIKTVVEEARHLEALLSGKCPFRNEPICPREIVDHIHFLQADALHAKSITMNVNYQASEERLTFCADKNLVIFQIFNNLISNAIKFSYPDSEILLNLYRREGFVVCEFIDHGVGMDEPLQKKIFDLNSHTTRRGTNGERGTGFGMPIVKACVERLGGSIEIESRITPPSGTTVRVLFTARIEE